MESIQEEEEEYIYPSSDSVAAEDEEPFDWNSQVVDYIHQADLLGSGSFNSVLNSFSISSLNLLLPPSTPDDSIDFWDERTLKSWGKWEDVQWDKWVITEAQLSDIKRFRKSLVYKPSRDKDDFNFGQSDTWPRSLSLGDEFLLSRKAKSKDALGLKVLPVGSAGLRLLSKLKKEGIKSPEEDEDMIIMQEMPPIEDALDLRLKLSADEVEFIMKQMVVMRDETKLWRKKKNKKGNSNSDMEKEEIDREYWIRHETLYPSRSLENIIPRAESPPIFSRPSKLLILPLSPPSPTHDRSSTELLASVLTGPLDETFSSPSGDHKVVNMVNWNKLEHIRPFPVATPSPSSHTSKLPVEIWSSPPAPSSSELNSLMNIDPPVFARNPLAFESKAKHLSYHHLSSSPSLTSLIPFMKQPEEEEEIDELDSDSEPEIFSQPLGNLTQLLQSSPLPPPPTSKPLGLVELYSSLHIPPPSLPPPSPLAQTLAQDLKLSKAPGLIALTIELGWSPWGTTLPAKSLTTFFGEDDDSDLDKNQVSEKVAGQWEVLNRNLLLDKEVEKEFEWGETSDWGNFVHEDDDKCVLISAPRGACYEDKESDSMEVDAEEMTGGAEDRALQREVSTLASHHTSLPSQQPEPDRDPPFEEQEEDVEMSMLEYPPTAPTAHARFAEDDNNDDSRSKTNSSPQRPARLFLPGSTPSSSGSVSFIFPAPSPTSSANAEEEYAPLSQSSRHNRSLPNRSLPTHSVIDNSGLSASIAEDDERSERTDFSPGNLSLATFVAINPNTSSSRPSPTKMSFSEAASNSITSSSKKHSPLVPDAITGSVQFGVGSNASYEEEVMVDDAPLPENKWEGNRALSLALLVQGRTSRQPKSKTVANTFATAVKKRAAPSRKEPLLEPVDVPCPIPLPLFITSSHSLEDDHRPIRVVGSLDLLQLPETYRALRQANFVLLDRPPRFKPHPYRTLEPHVILDPRTCVLYKPLAKLVGNVTRPQELTLDFKPEREEAIFTTLVRLLESGFDRVLIVFEAGTTNFLTNCGRILSPFTPPVCAALLSLVDAMDQLKSAMPSATLEVVISNDATHSAEITRRLALCLADDDEITAEDSRAINTWNDRMWLADESTEGERDFLQIPELNYVAAAALNACVSLSEFVQLHPQQRARTLGYVCGMAHANAISDRITENQATFGYESTRQDANLPVSSLDDWCEAKILGSEYFDWKGYKG